MIRWNEEYQVYVSDDGHVYNKEMKEYKLHITKNGYVRFSTHKNKCKVQETVHKLVWLTFNGNYSSDMQIDHIDNNKSNNKLSNLQLLTPQANSYKRLSTKTDFGIKYLEHFGYSRKENPDQYEREFCWFRRHNNTCRWE